MSDAIPSPADVYVPLRCRTIYSVGEGAIEPKALVDAAKAAGLPAIGVADAANLFGSLDLADAATKAGIQPVFGCIVEVEHPDGAVGKVALYARTPEGWQNLSDLSSLSYLSPRAGRHRIAWKDLAARSAGLSCLVGARDGLLGTLLLASKAAEAEAVARDLAKIFPDGELLAEIHRHGPAEDGYRTASEAAIEDALVGMADRLGMPLVAVSEAYFLEASMHEAHDAFLAIGASTTLADEKRRRVTENHRLRSPAEMVAAFVDFPDALANTGAFARRCSVWPEGQKPILPLPPRFRGTDPNEALPAQAHEGLTRRLAAKGFTPSATEADYRARVDYECGVISKMGFAGYFLIVADFIAWAKEHGIPVGPGPGSGAGFAVAWSLTITDLDRIRYGLLFERS